MLITDVKMSETQWDKGNWQDSFYADLTLFYDSGKAGYIALKGDPSNGYYCATATIRVSDRNNNQLNEYGICDCFGNFV